jgi:hypothetical protein
MEKLTKKKNIYDSIERARQKEISPGVFPRERVFAYFRSFFTVLTIWGVLKPYFSNNSSGSPDSQNIS